MIETDSRPWYREPETFIAIAALVVSVSAVVVGLYETSLQRTHDRAEVWPHVELATYTSTVSASLTVENNGIGPAIIHSVIVSVDGKPRRNWAEVLKALTDSLPAKYSAATVGDRAMRGGDRTTVLEVPIQSLPPGFWSYIGRVGVQICYASVFGDQWLFSVPHIGSKNSWDQVDRCPEPTPGADF